MEPEGDVVREMERYICETKRVLARWAKRECSLTLTALVVEHSMSHNIDNNTGGRVLLTASAGSVINRNYKTACLFGRLRAKRKLSHDFPANWLPNNIQ